MKMRLAVADPDEPHLGRGTISMADLEMKRLRHLIANKNVTTDAFAAALARQKKATLFTGDRDFKQVEGEIKIGWLK